MHHHLAAAGVRKIKEPRMPRLEQFTVHGRGEKRAIPESHVFEEIKAVRLSFQGKKCFEMIDDLIGVYIDHVLNPLGIQSHADKEIFVSAYRMHQLKWCDYAAEQKELFLGAVFLH